MDKTDEGPTPKGNFVDHENYNCPNSGGVQRQSKWKGKGTCMKKYSDLWMNGLKNFIGIAALLHVFGGSSISWPTILITTPGVGALMSAISNSVHPWSFDYLAFLKLDTNRGGIGPFSPLDSG